MTQMTPINRMKGLWWWMPSLFHKQLLVAFYPNYSCFKNFFWDIGIRKNFAWDVGIETPYWRPLPLSHDSCHQFSQRQLKFKIWLSTSIKKYAKKTFLMKHVPGTDLEETTLKFMNHHGIWRNKLPAVVHEKRLINEHAHYFYQQIK